MEEPKAVKPPRQKPAAPVEPTPAPAISTDRDDLTVIEGIGPKIQMLLNQYGIQTYRHLAEADVVRLKEILAAAGPQLAMHDPGTWPSQANLAANDQWDTLKSVQGFLKGGKKPD
jgi:predicted flap endonuclease-1-like 5' DNA nuclease